jgi:hypothetical protein
MKNRVLAWDGCTNVRDLGGLRTFDGRLTRWGTVVRSDHPAKLSAAGWSALYGYGIRTIITLCTHGLEEDLPDSGPRPPDITTVKVEIEDITDQAFVQQWVDSGLWCTPLYYRDALRCWPERHATAIRAVARARPGGVLIHCTRGNDRTGIISLLLLSLTGVTAEEIIADYQLSPDPEREDLLAGAHATVKDALLGTLEGINIESYLIKGGASQEDLDSIRSRLLG